MNSSKQIYIQYKTNAKSGSYKVVAKNAPNGVRIVSENGEVKDQLSVGEKISYPNS